MENKSPFQVFIDKSTNLSIDSEIKSLPSYQKIVSPDISGQSVAEILEVLIIENRNLIGVISRETFYENAGKRFGPEIFFNRSILKMLETSQCEPFILPGNMLITIATKKALNRDLKSIYQPIIVEQCNQDYSLISPLILFIAQSEQLLELQNQRLFTVNAGQNISEKEAIKRFLRHVGNRPEFNLDMFLKHQAVRCDSCMEMVNFSIVDVIRTFSQLNRGIIVEEKMGTRVYRLFIRHSCKNNEIWEIPVQLDEHLEYRSQRPARAVESYV
jgi:hypothetical protein